MTIDSLLARARYLVLALPLFGLATTVHTGCNAGPNGLYYSTYGNVGNHVPSTAASPDTTESCVVYRNGYDGDAGFYAPCDDDESYGTGEHGGSGGYGGDGP